MLEGGSTGNNAAPVSQPCEFPLEFNFELQLAAPKPAPIAPDLVQPRKPLQPALPSANNTHRPKKMQTGLVLRSVESLHLALQMEVLTCSRSLNRYL